MKRLSNKKYLLNKLLWAVCIGWTILFFLMMIGCATPAPAPVKTEPTFCQLWNEGPQKGMEQPFTPAQNKMLHMAYFLSKEELVRTMLIQNYPNQQRRVDAAMTCYTENIIFLVEEVDEICKCSSENRVDETVVAWNNYMNDCWKEAGIEK